MKKKHALSSSTSQWARKFKKVQAKKNSWNQINQFHEKKFFWPNSIFCHFKKWPKINFWTGKKFRSAKNAIFKKNFDLFDFTSFFFAWTFFQIRLLTQDEFSHNMRFWIVVKSRDEKSYISKSVNLYYASLKLKATTKRVWKVHQKVTTHVDKVQFRYFCR